MNRTGVTGDPRPHVCTLFRDRTSNGGPLHFTFVVDDDSSVIFEVNGGTILSVKRLRLPNDDTWHDLFPKFRLTFLDGAHDHVADGGCWHSVESTFVTDDGDDVQVFGTGVVGAVHDGGNWKGERDMEFASQRTSSSSLRHFLVLVLPC